MKTILNKAAKAVFLCLLFSSCTTIHVYSEGDVVVDAHKEIVMDAN